MHKERATQRMIPRGPVRFQGLYRPSTGITQARFELVFNRNHPEKTTLDAGIVSDLIAGKSKSTKSIAYSDRQTPWGVTAPSARLAGWCRDKRDSCHGFFGSQMRPRHAIRQTVGAPSDPRYGCAIIRGGECQWVKPFTHPCDVALTVR